jgi:FeS assembly protein IscX
MDWGDYELIGEALAKAYPDIVSIDLSLDELARLVVGLPGFRGAAQPPDWRYLTAVETAWRDALRTADTTE